MTVNSASDNAKRRRLRRPMWVGVAVITVVVAALAVTYFVTRPPDQAQVGADRLPTVAEAQQAAAYLDCSKINSIAYFSDNPCQTFVLLESHHFPSAEEFSPPNPVS